MRWGGSIRSGAKLIWEGDREGRRRADRGTPGDGTYASGTHGDDTYGACVC